jgi:hypothetical protein
MIVKVQIPLMPVDGEALIYNKDQSVWTMVAQEELPPAVLQLAGRTGKGFFHAEITDEHKLLIGKEAPWQEW